MTIHTGEATMLIENTAGYTLARHIKIVNIKDNSDSLSLWYKVKGGRKTTGVRIDKKGTQLTLAKGWQQPTMLTDNTKRSTFGYMEFVIFGDGNFSRPHNELEDIFYTHNNGVEVKESKPLPPHLSGLFDGNGDSIYLK